MADIVNLSNAESPLKSILSADGNVRNPFLYSVRSNTPSFSKSITEVSVSNPATGKNHTIEIPRYGLLAQIVLKANVTQNVAGTGDWADDFASWFFKRCELQTHNKVIEATSDLYHHVRIEEAPYGEHQASLNAGGGMVDNVATDIYLKVPLSVCNTTKTFLDTRFLEQLSLNVLTATPAQCSYDSAGAPPAIAVNSMSAFLTYINPEEQFYRSLQNEQFNNENGSLTMLLSDRYSENATKGSSVANAASSSLSQDVKCQNLVFKTHVMLRDQTKAENATNGAKPEEMEPVTRIVVRGSGRDMMDVQGDQLLLLEGDFNRFSGASGNKTGASASRIYTINWGLESDRTSDSGSVSWKNLTSPTIDVYFTNSTGGAVSYQVDVVHEYWSLVDINSADGRVSKGINV